MPVASNTVPRGGVAFSDLQGYFEAYFIRSKGLPAGTYKVSATTKEQPNEQNPQGTPEKVPIVYRESDSSPIEIVVSSGGSNEFTFELKSSR